MPLGVMLLPSLLAGVFQSTTITVMTIRANTTSPIFVQVVKMSLRSFRTFRLLERRLDRPDLHESVPDYVGPTMDIT